MSQVILEGKNGQYEFDPTQEVPDDRKGGMGIVYWGEKVESQEKVAIKVIYQELAQDDANIQRAKSEANVKFDHPNLLKMLDFVEKDGIYHIVSERLEGQTLEQFLHSNGAINSDYAIDITKAILDGLQELHNHNPEIIHRDIKPSNVFLGNDGSIKLMDFGIAKISGDVRRTKVGTLNGTPHYAPPEQIRGEQEKIGVTSDIYSTGIVLYEMLSGNPPFDATNEFDIQKKHIEEPLPENSKIPERIFNEIQYASRKEFDRRPQSASELKNLLIEAVSGKKQSNSSAGSSEIKEENNGWKTAGILFIVISVVLGIVSISQNSQKEQWKRKYDSETYRTDRLESENNRLESRNTSLTSEIKTLESTISSLKKDKSELQNLANSYPPIMIRGISFKADDGSYGGSMYRRLKYIYPRILYNSLSSYSRDITVYVKIYDPSGNLKQGSSSPTGYTFSTSFEVKGSYSTYEYEYISGWGNKSGNSYSSGKHAYEVWYGGRRLYKTSFTVY